MTDNIYDEFDAKVTEFVFDLAEKMKIKEIAQTGSIDPEFYETQGPCRGLTFLIANKVNNANTGPNRDGGVE